MKISLNWVKDFVDIPPKYSAKGLAELLTLRTCEVESFEDQTMLYHNMVVGRVEKVRPHPNADKLRIADTHIGKETVPIVCGGKNLREGMLVSVALPGAVVNWHGTGEWVELKATKVRGEMSHGMICSGEEIGQEKSPPEEIMDLSHLHAKVGTPLTEVWNLTDVIFDIDNKSLTHRPDLWGHYGMAREFAAFLGKKLKPYPAERSKISFPKSGEQVKLEILDSEISPRFTACMLSGIEVKESPEWLKVRLRACGMRPVNNVVDITNYVMLELGQPMHAFDRRTVGTDHFVVRWAHEGEMVETIDHKKRVLTKKDAVITDGKKPLVIAGIMGGLESEIHAQTREIILEAANWNPVMIRKTAQRLGLRTESAQRYEKSLDPLLTELAIKRACELLLQTCPRAKIAGPLTDQRNFRLKPPVVRLELPRVWSKIGDSISERDIVKSLGALSFTVKKSGVEALTVTVPSFRATKDIQTEDDLIEEVARMHGYEKIKPKLPDLPIRLPIENRERTLKHKVRKILSLGLRMTETSHYSFYSKKEIAQCLLPEEVHLEIENPLSSDQTHLRASLLPHLLRSVAANLPSRHRFQLYEIGRTYIKRKDYFPLEEKFVCALFVRHPKKDGEVFYDARGGVEAFLTLFGALPFHIAEPENIPSYAHPKKCAVISFQNTPIGLLYELHPQVLRNYEIDAKVSAFEINFSRLAALPLQERTYRPLPRFPGIEIDISVVTPKRTPVHSVHELIFHAGQPLMSDVTFLDIFESSSLGQDKKSLTFRVLLQSPERTLTDEEMQNVQQRIFKTLRDQGFAIRGFES